MARTQGSFFRTIMPLLKRHRVIAINWGLVTGKTNTRYAWDDPHPDGSEPNVWLHDILRPNGSPYIPQEVEFIKKPDTLNGERKNNYIFYIIFIIFV